MRGDLPGSQQIVVSRSVECVDEPTAAVVGGVDEALDRARGLAPDETVYVLGGGAIYGVFQPHVDAMVLSRVDGRYEGDTRFPEWDREKWALTAETEYDGFSLRTWHRRAEIG
jgi:Dihydrofolate reductase